MWKTESPLICARWLQCSRAQPKPKSTTEAPRLGETKSKSNLNTEATEKLKRALRNGKGKSDWKGKQRILRGPRRI
jgi:hypothetical protein